MCPQVDFNKLIKEVDEGFYTWRKPTALCFGSSDPFLDVSSVFDFLESKRTNMKAMSIGAKVRNAWLQQVYWLVPVHLHLFACVAKSCIKSTAFGLLHLLPRSTFMTLTVLCTSAQMGHMPQEDYPEVLYEQVKLFLTGSVDEW